jgi:hypothetical protein
VIDVSSTIESDGGLQRNLCFDVFRFKRRFVFLESGILYVNNGRCKSNVIHNISLMMLLMMQLKQGSVIIFEGMLYTSMISPLIAGSKAP